MTDDLEERFGQMMNDMSTAINEISCKLGEIEEGSGILQKNDQLGSVTIRAMLLLSLQNRGGFVSLHRGS